MSQECAAVIAEIASVEVAYATFDEIESQREDRIKELKFERSQLDVKDRKYQRSLDKIEQEIAKLSYPKSVLQQAADHACELRDANDARASATAEVDIFFCMQFLALCNYLSKEALARRRLKPRAYGNDAKFLAAEVRLLLRANSSLMNAKLLRLSKEPEDQETVKGCILYAAYFEQNYEIRRKLLEASRFRLLKPRISNKVKAEVKAIMDRRQQIEDALRKLRQLDKEDKDARVAFSETCSLVLGMKGITFASDSTAFGRAKQLEALWMEKLGYVADGTS